MKTTIRVICTLCMLVLCVSLSAQEKKVPAEMLGKWKYTVENPQSGESMNGTCVVATGEEATKATFDMGYGPAETTAFRPGENGKCTAELPLQDFSMALTFSMKESKLVCDIDINGNLFSIEMTKE